MSFAKPTMTLDRRIPGYRLLRFVTFLLGTALASCSPPPASLPRASRLLVGDRVTPEIVLAGVWQADAIGQLDLRLRLVRQAADAGFLLDRDVPDDLLPQVELTYYRGDEVLPCDAKNVWTARFC